MRALTKRTLQSAAAATQVGTSLIVQGTGACALEITGTFVGTVTFQAKVNEDGTTWPSIRGTNISDGTRSATATAPGVYIFGVAGIDAIRANITAYTSGAITVVGREIDGTFGPADVNVTGSNATLAPNTSATGKDGEIVGGIDPATGKMQALKVSSDGTLATNTTATATFNDKHEVLVVPTRLYDFAGKTAGQTWDVPHVAKNRWATLTEVPSGANASEFNAANYSQVASQDNTSEAYSLSTNGLYAQHLFSFDILTIAHRTPGIPSNWTVADLKANLKAFTVAWAGYGVGANTGAPANGAKIKGWRVSTLSWADVIITVADTAPKLYLAGISDFVNYIDDNGFLHLLAHTTYASDGTNPSTIYTDYIKVEMQLIGSALNDQTIQYADEQNIGQTTVTAGATTAIATALDTSRCSDYALAITPSATHTWSATGAPLGRDSVALVATADRTALIASASQGLKMSAKTAVLAPKLTVYVTNGDASDRTYYGRFIRLGTKGARQS